jgi:transposase
VLLAEDEAALYLQATTTAVWAVRGQPPVVPVDPRRQKVCCYGTLNLGTGQDVVWQTTKMNAGTTAQHLQQLLDTYPEVPILLLWDRAPWHRGPAIRALCAAHPRLELMQLPVAAPELNPQEHVWKATRRAVSHNHHIRRLPELADKFARHLQSTTFHSSLLDRYGYHDICAMFK